MSLVSDHTDAADAGDNQSDVEKVALAAEEKAKQDAAGENPTWNENIDESMRGRIDKFKDVNGLAKGYTELEDKLSAGFKKPETDEEKAKLWAKLGRPVDAEGYELEDDDALGFKAHAFQLGFTQDQVTHHEKWFKGIIERHGESIKEKSKASEVKLREKWGNEYSENVVLANRELTASYSDDLVDRLEQGGFLDDAEFISHLHREGKRAADDKIGGGGNLREVERTEAGQPYLEFPSMEKYE